MISVPAYKPAMRYQDHKNEILCNLFHQILFYQEFYSLMQKNHPSTATTSMAFASAMGLKQVL